MLNALLLVSRPQNRAVEDVAPLVALLHAPVVARVTVIALRVLQVAERQARVPIARFATLDLHEHAKIALGLVRVQRQARGLVRDLLVAIAVEVVLAEIGAPLARLL